MSIGKAIEANDRLFEERDKVVGLHLKGVRPATISRELGIARKDVNGYISTFQEYAKDNELLQERGRQVVHEFDNQQDRLMEELWKAVDEADMANDYKTKGVLLKTLHDIQKGRVDTMQKAGMLSDAAMGDEMAALEEKQEILIQILKEVSSSCNKCKMEVHRKLARVTGKPEPVVVDAE